MPAVKESRRRKGRRSTAPALTNAAGTVVALMPHPERDAWTFMHRDGPAKLAARGSVTAMLAPSGGSRFFSAFAQALGVGTGR